MARPIKKANRSPAKGARGSHVRSSKTKKRASSLKATSRRHFLKTSGIAAAAAAILPAFNRAAAQRVTSTSSWLDLVEPSEMLDGEGSSGPKACLSNYACYYSLNIEPYFEYQTCTHWCGAAVLAMVGNYLNAVDDNPTRYNQCSLVNDYTNGGCDAHDLDYPDLTCDCSTCNVDYSGSLTNYLSYINRAASDFGSGSPRDFECPIASAICNWNPIIVIYTLVIHAICVAGYDFCDSSIDNHSVLFCDPDQTYGGIYWWSYYNTSQETSSGDGDLFTGYWWGPPGALQHYNLGAMGGIY
jgi:hypothetical protein